jgi:hypothetical protein
MDLKRDGSRVEYVIEYLWGTRNHLPNLKFMVL